MANEETMSIPAAGREYYGIGRSASYEAADRGDIPFFRVGKLRRVPRRAMEELVRTATEETLRRARIRGTELAAHP